MKVREVTTGISAVTSNIGVLPKAEVYYSAVQTLNWSFPKVVGFQIETTENLTCLLPTVTGKGENTYSITCTNCDDSLQKTKNYRFSEPLTTADSLEIRFPCYPDTGFDVNFLPGNFARNLSDFYWKHETIDTLDSFVYYSEIGRLNNLGEYSKSYDFNEDGVLNELDRNEMDKIVPYSTVSNRKLFYNRTSSTVFGDGSGNPISSIDKSKSAFFPGGKGNRLKYSNYTKGINGIIVDFSGKVGNISASDFEFEIWNGIDTIGFKPPNTIATVTKLPFGGYFTEHRVKIEFPDYAIKNTWLKVRIHAGENSGLKTDEVFYFGNIVGDVGNDPIDVLNVDDMDINLVSQNQSPSMNSVTITNTYDVNKDGRVNAIDLSSVKQNLGESVIKYFLAPLE